MEATGNKLSKDMMNELEEAIQYHQAGQLEDAQKAYHRILTINPDHYEALHLLGTIAYQTGNYENAATLISSAIRNGPQNPFYYISLGDALKAQS
ncbi:MAG: tetratricopeptide repeat protein, partial [Desulfobacterales bacterium]